MLSNKLTLQGDPSGTVLQIRRLALFVLAFTLAVILWGAYVRATGSGAGCGSHWPLCNGEILPHLPSEKTRTEFLHRATSGITLILVLALGRKVLRSFPEPSLIRSAAVVSCISIVLEALIGAGLVLFELVYKNQSIKRTLSIALHFSNTLVLVAALVLLIKALTQPQGTWQWPSRAIRAQSFAFIFLFFLVGMAGAITALGDTLFPAQSLVQGFQQDWDPSSHFLIKLRIIHPILAATLAALLSPWATGFFSPKTSPLRSAGIRLITCLVLNLALGVANLVSLAPITLQMLHLLMGLILWILFVLFLYELSHQPTVQVT